LHWLGSSSISSSSTARGHHDAIDAQLRDDLITWDEANAKKLALKIERGAVVYIAMNEDADYEVGATEDEATERLSDNVGGRLGRVVRLTIRMSPPKAEDAGEVRSPTLLARRRRSKPRENANILGRPSGRPFP
jgi:hypothetical protein